MICHMRAQIRRSINNIFIAKGEDGREYTLKIKGKVLSKEKWEYNPIAVGDFVEISIHSDNEGLIISREERKSEFTRFLNKVGLNQCTCSNMDQAVIVSSIKSPVFNPRFIDRCIASVRGCPVLIAVNKEDLGVSYEERDLSLYQSLGYGLVLLSAKDKKADSLIPYLENKVSAFIGPSGVGKSSLINLLTGSEQKVGTLSDKYNRGKHTTNHALFIESSLYSIIDTPGIREIIPPFENPEDLKHSFPELSDVGCRYSDCLHNGESGCIVPFLVEEGRIDEGRYAGYLALLEDLMAVHDRIVKNRW